MTPTQREAAARLVDWLHASGVVNSEVKETIALLRELAAPQQRQPLTDEQIDRLDTQAIHGGPDSQYAFRFARLIERAHGIGGKE